MYPLVRVNPDHAEFHIARKAVCPGQIACPQASTQSILGAVGDVERLLVIGKGQHGHERPEDLFLRDAIMI